MNVHSLIIEKNFMIKPILVTGKNSQLGRSLQKITRDIPYFLNNITSNSQSYGNSLIDNLSLTCVTREELDLSNTDLIKNFFQTNEFSGIINFAAYTSVDKAEDKPELAEQINHFAVAQLAKIAKSSAIPLIHISTDYVFNGKSSNPRSETDKTDPQNIYGLTKLKGENAMMEAGCKGAIIRTSWLYSEFGNNFVKTILNLGRKQESIKVVNDQVGSPTYASNLASMILVMLNNRRTMEILNSQLNIFHFSDDGSCSWYDFAKTIIKLSKLKCIINPLDTKDYPLPAKRPKYNIMSKAKIKEYLPELLIPHWEDSLINSFDEIYK